ncbi:MAG: hypothetical protein FJX74_11580 [Armatimonadetes bacterium]|nr:hypothetical protein [Armatimonadota bacterium]
MADRLRGFERRRRHLPHHEEPGATYFVTATLFRPPAVDLTRSDIGCLVVEALLFRDGAHYALYDYTVMPDHFHAILKPTVTDCTTPYLYRIMQGVKSWLAREINRRAGRRGRLWQDESYDRIIRDEAEYQRCAQYILDNPRMEGLIEDPMAWPWWGKGSGQ